MPGTDDDDSEAPLPAGALSAWFTALQAALRGEGPSDVPCGSCTACCTSSQFVHIAPDETDTLAHVPAALRFPAPGLPEGHVLLGYDERGHCPMLVDGRCSIYEHRPRTCRTYDCRIFPATGVAPDDDKPAIARQARRWVFAHPTADDHLRHEALRAAARHVGAHRADLPDGLAPTTATQLAVRAVAVAEVFLHHDEATGEAVVAEPAPAAVRVALTRSDRGRRYT